MLSNITWAKKYLCLRDYVSETAITKKKGGGGRLVAPQTFLFSLLLSENSWGERGKEKEEEMGCCSAEIPKCCGRGLRGVEHCSHWRQDLSKHLLPTRSTLPRRSAQLHKISNLSLDFIYFSMCFGETSLSFLPRLQIYTTKSICLPPQTNSFCRFSPLYIHELYSKAQQIKLSATSTSKWLISVEKWQMEDISPPLSLATLQSGKPEYTKCAIILH